MTNAPADLGGFRTGTVIPLTGWMAERFGPRLEGMRSGLVGAGGEADEAARATHRN